MKYLATIVLLMLSLFLTGCIVVPFPHLSQKSPAIDGRVVDTNGCPVKGAHIELEDIKAYGRSNESWLISGARITTGPNGCFNLGPTYNLHLLWYSNPSFQFYIPGGAFWTGCLKISCEGFNTKMFDSGSTTNGHLGDLQVTPATLISQP